MKQILFALSLFFGIAISAQQWRSNDYYVQGATKSGFTDLQQAFSLWAADKDLDQIKGWKQFKRWEYFYFQRLYPSFNMPDARLYMRERDEFIRKFGDGAKAGASWTNLSPSSVPVCADTSNITGMGRINCISFHPTDTHTIFIGASNGGAWKSTDDGQNWTALTEDIPMLRVSDIAIHPYFPDTMYLATGDIDHIVMSLVSPGGAFEYGMGVLKTYDGGLTWDTTGLRFDAAAGETNLIRKVVIQPDSVGHLLAAGSAGVWKSTDGGDNWYQTLTGQYTDLEVNPQNPNVMYLARIYVPGVVGSKASIYKSVDFGESWVEQTSGIPATGVVYRTELAIAPTDTARIYAISCGTSGGFHSFYSSSDGGTTWTKVASTLAADEAPNMLGWADGGYFGFSFPGVPPDDAGQGTYDLTLIVNPHDADLVYTGGVNMWSSSNGGIGGGSSTWNVVSMWLTYFGPSIHADQHFSCFHPFTGKFFQATDGGLYVTDSLITGNLDAVLPCVNLTTFEIIPGCYNLPSEWTELSGGLHITEYYRLALCQSKPDMVVAGAQDNGTFMFNDGNWLQTLGGDGMEAMINPNDPNVIYATNYSGALSKSTDGGLTYTSGLETPITDAGETGDWVTPYVMHPWYPEVLFTAFQEIWKSEDGGTTWNPISNISNAYSFTSLAISPIDPSYIYAARRDNIFRSADGGQTWVSIESGLPTSEALLSYIAVSEVDTQTVFVVFSGFAGGKKVYRSTDAGANWENISLNLPNVPFNCIVHQGGTNLAGDPINGLYAGSDIGVFFTNDSLINVGDNWVLFSNGMPAVVVSELEIQYSAQKIVAATYGRGLWESPLYQQSHNVSQSVGEVSTLSLNFYPNPGNGLYHLQLPYAVEGDVKYSVIDVNGKEVAIGILSANSGLFEASIDLSYLIPGNYLIRVNNGNAVYQTQFVQIKQ